MSDPDPDWLPLLRGLVQADSTNPGAYEGAVAGLVEGWLADCGVPVQRVESLPGRHSLAAAVEGDGGGPTVILNGHMDTVPVGSASAWTVPPFEGLVRDGRLYGRGACDMKAGLALQVRAARRLRGRAAAFRGRLVLHFAVGEECGEPGTESLLAAGFGGDEAIVLEPTDGAVGVAGRGLCHLRIVCPGRAQHASTADRRSNPVWALPTLLAAVDAYATAIADRSHPWLGAPKCTPTVVHVGTKANATGDEAVVIVDRRLLPGEVAERERDALARCLAAAFGDERCAVAVEEGSFPPVEVPESAALVRCLQRAGAAATGVPFASDAGRLRQAGIATVTFGPGRIEDCHGPDESVSLQSVAHVAQVLDAVIDQRLSVTPR